jgi:hypothetical protein
VVTSSHNKQMIDTILAIKTKIYNNLCKYEDENDKVGKKSLNFMSDLVVALRVVELNQRTLKERVRTL